MRIGRVTAWVHLSDGGCRRLSRRPKTPRRTKHENSVTVYGGERFGGSLTDTTSNSNISLQSGSSFAVAVDIGLDHGTQLEFFYSRQNTSVTSSAFSSQANNVGLTLNNYHLGGHRLHRGEWAADCT